MCTYNLQIKAKQVSMMAMLIQTDPSHIHILPL